jgi:hypothetical protein
MKQLFFILFCMYLPKFLFAQSDAYLDINNLNIGFNSNNSMFVDYIHWQANYEFPKGSGKHSNFLNSFLISALDTNNELHTSAQLFNLFDFFSGPLDSNDYIDPSISSSWNYVWKVNLSTIDSFTKLTNHTLSNTPNEILIWPAKGNVHARGKNNTVLIVDENSAPYIDVNADEVYNALDGDYPAIKGDQALWWVFSDNGLNHNCSRGKPLKVQCQVMAYACKYKSLENVFFVDVAILNKSDMPYHDMRTGLLSFIDLGRANDDYIGCDTEYNLAITYNGQSTDDVYNIGLTQHGCMLLKSPATSNFGDSKLGSFMLMNTWNFPSIDSEFHHAMHSKFKNGTPQVKSCNMLSGTGPTVQYSFAGDFGSNDGSNEKDCGNPSGERAYLLVTKSYNLAPNNFANHTYAFMNTPIGSSNTTFSILQDLAKDIRIDYNYNPNGCNNYPLIITDFNLQNSFSIYPQPSKEQITISSNDIFFTDISLFSIDGKLILQNHFEKTLFHNLRMPTLSVGNYIIVVDTQKGIVRKKIVVE